MKKNTGVLRYAQNDAIFGSIKANQQPEDEKAPAQLLALILRYAGRLTLLDAEGSRFLRFATEWKCKGTANA